MLLNYGEEFIMKYDPGSETENLLTQYYGDLSQVKLPYKFSLFSKFERESKELLKLQIRKENDLNLAIYIIGCYT